MNVFYRWLLLIAVGLIVVVVVGYLLVARGVLELNNPNVSMYPVRGLDVSHHQGSIDWEEVSNSGYVFAFIKATEGGDHRDNNFVYNWKEAQKAGLKVSAYHYYSFCKTPSEQFSNFSNVVPKNIGGIPPAIDLEYDKNCNSAIDVDAFRLNLLTFITKIKSFYHVNPVLYCNEDFYLKYLAVSDFDDCLIWVRNTYKRPDLGNGVLYEFWQYSSKGSVKGVKGFVDLNVYNGTKDQFLQMFPN